MSGKLSTHVLDTASGKPAGGVRIDLFRVTAEAALIGTFETNADGRTDRPLLEGEALTAGTYQLVFYVGDYFRKQGHADAGKFLEHVPVVFAVTDARAKYHVPLLVSPWSYSTYRGS
jgi:5-hydroxyisourate hydrolase